LLLCCTGCFGGGGAKVERKELSAIVLQPADLSSGWVRFDEGRQTRADARGDAARFGRIDGWKARYKRSGNTTSGPLVIDSRADLFESAGGATQELDRLKAASHLLAGVPEVGEGRVATTQRQAGTPAVRFYTITWRQGNVAASLSVNGFDGKVTFDQALELAYKQQRRIDRAERH
jgi:hypothetical protein